MGVATTIVHMNSFGSTIIQMKTPVFLLAMGMETALQFAVKMVMFVQTMAITEMIMTFPALFMTII
jgi:hypothetical protein